MPFLVRDSCKLVRQIFFLVLFGLFFYCPAYARGDDTISVKDSLRFYKKIKQVAYKNKITKWAYNLVFVDPQPERNSDTDTVSVTSKLTQKELDPFRAYRGRKIRNIHIIVFDPFGYSVTDTVPQKVNGIQRAANFSHVKSRQWMINNRLLFKKHDTINPIALSETERLLRSAVFINDARITVTRIKKTDSVDVNVFVHDKWPLEVPVLVTDVSANIRLRSQNLLGLGQQFEQYVAFRRPDVFEHNGFYSIDNIDETFIAARLSYQANSTYTQAGISFNRGFFSPLALWAGGLSVYDNLRNFEYVNKEDSAIRQSGTNELTGDAWLGRAFKLSTEKTFFHQSTNLITGIRYYKNHYLKRPSIEIDTSRSIFHTSGVVGNVGIAIQHYYKDKYIYRFGANEDVPEGLIVQFLYGGLRKELNKIRFYTGIELARAKHFDFGYLSLTYAHGVFYNKKVPNDVTTHFKIYFFSNLKRIGKWHFRQFINTNYVYGVNKIFNETLTLSSDELYGFSPGSLAGTTKVVVNSETVAYAPYTIIGFKFAPVLMVGLGMMGNEEVSLHKSNLFQGYSLGILLRNENLVTSTFQFSFGYYPFLPDGTNSVWKYNPVTSFTLRVRAFSVERPDFIHYY
jgi:hypothetical protein